MRPDAAAGAKMEGRIQEERFTKVWFGLARFGIQEERFGKGGTGARSDRLGNDGGLQVRYQH